MIRLPCPVRAGRHPFLVVVVALTLGATLVTAQMELAVVLGTVKDDAGQPLAEVTFRLRDLERGRDTIIRSDKAGRFYRRGLQAVEYELFVEKEGYQPIHDKIRLTAGIDRRFDFKLVKAAPAGAEEFAREGIQIRWHQFTHPAYKQCGPAPFIAGLAAVDLLFNAGPASRAILMGEAATHGACAAA